MIGKLLSTRRFRDFRSWSCEVRYGVPMLEEVVSRSSGDRSVPCDSRQDQRYQAFVKTEIRRNVVNRRRVLISIWSCWSTEDGLSPASQAEMIRKYRAIRRLAELKYRVFVQERSHGQGKAEEEAP